MSVAVQGLRVALGAGGLTVIVAGVASLVGTTTTALVSVLLLAVLGIIAHDGVIAPLTVAGGAAARRLLPRGYLAPLVVATALVGSLTVVAIPVLVGVDESPDNATVVDRPYGLSWLAVVGVASLAVALVGAARSHDGAPVPVPVAAAASGGVARPSTAHRAGRSLLAVLVGVAAAVVLVRSGAARPGRPERRGQGGARGR